MKYYNFDRTIMVDIDNVSYFDIGYIGEDPTLYISMIIDGVELKIPANTNQALVNILKMESTDRQLLLKK